MKKKSAFAIRNYFLVFITICVIATASVLSFVLTYQRNQNVTKSAIATSIVIVVLNLLCILGDYIRRKYRIVNPIDKIVSATEEITKGNFDIHLKPRHRYGAYNEFDILMENINQMAVELSKNEILKTDFIANVSHEIKTPLAIISNYASLIADETLSFEERKEYANTLVTATKRLSNLITNILRLNKLENQQLGNLEEEFSLTDALSEIILSFEDLFDKKNIELFCDLEEVEIKSSKDYLDIVWSNLLSNAVKFTPIGGKIWITLKKESHFVFVRIKDNGCGMSKETGDHIFDKFYQGDTSHKEEGNGLGLSLVKKVIDIIGGEISVESEIGIGSEFMVKLSQEM